MNKTIRVTGIISATVGLTFAIIAAIDYGMLLENVVTYLGYVTPVIDSILTFVRPFLETSGGYITDIVNNLLGSFPFGDYTIYMIIAGSIAAVALILAIKYPGYDDPKKVEKKKKKAEKKAQKKK